MKFKQIVWLLCFLIVVEIIQSTDDTNQILKNREVKKTQKCLLSFQSSWMTNFFSKRNKKVHSLNVKEENKNIVTENIHAKSLEEKQEYKLSSGESSLKTVKNNLVGTKQNIVLIKKILQYFIHRPAENIQTIIGSYLFPELELIGLSTDGYTSISVDTSTQYQCLFYQPCVYLNCADSSHVVPSWYHNYPPLATTSVQYIFEDFSQVTFCCDCTLHHELIISNQPSGWTYSYLFVPSQFRSIKFEKYCWDQLQDFEWRMPFAGEHNVLDICDVTRFYLHPAVHKLPLCMHRLFLQNVDILSMEFQPGTRVKELIVHEQNYPIDWATIKLPQTVYHFIIVAVRGSFFQRIHHVQNAHCVHHVNVDMQHVGGDNLSPHIELNFRPFKNLRMFSLRSEMLFHFHILLPPVQNILVQMFVNTFRNRQGPGIEMFYHTSFYQHIIKLALYFDVFLASLKQTVYYPPKVEYLSIYIGAHLIDWKHQLVYLPNLRELNVTLDLQESTFATYQINWSRLLDFSLLKTVQIFTFILRHPSAQQESFTKKYLKYPRKAKSNLNIVQ